ELTLIPMYFIIGIWGGERRIYAAVKFVLFTLVGSLLMLVGILTLGYLAGDAVNGGVFTTDWFKLLAYNTPLGAQTWLFFLFALSFAIKVPLFPFHTWLPDAHVEAPTGGSVILAGVLLKMGTYGLVRFCLPFFPNAAQKYALLFAVLAVIGIIYGALVSRVQVDAKKLVAYSSVSHLGFVVLGIFAFTAEAMQGSIIQMVNHGLSTGALFLLVGMLYERRHTRLMADFGGIAKSVPILTFFMVFSVLASAGLPGLNGFVGEFMILLGSFKSEVIGRPILIGLATTGVILAAVYLLWLLFRTFFGSIDREENRLMPDMNLREIALMAPLAILMLVLGIAPNTFLEKSESSTQFLLEAIETKRLAVLDAEPLEEETAHVYDGTLVASAEFGPPSFPVVLASASQELPPDTAGVIPDEHAEGEHGPIPPWWMILPFVAILLMIATGPLFYPHHWHHHYPKYAMGLGAFVAIYYLFFLRSPTPMVHALQEYLSFIALVASLFIAASGIFLSINARGTPFVNSVVLFVGSVVANLIATTGAAMLFIRPYMRLNRGRLKPYHIVFFIFLVANVGGALTPIGDPPLFLGFLRGVPFFWTLAHVWYIWLPSVLLLLGIFYVIDSRNKGIGPEVDPNAPGIGLVGRKNFIWVLIIIVSVFIDPNVFDFVPVLAIGDVHLPFGIREIIMFSVCILGYKMADKTALEKNEFSFEPIREVGWLFLGIFATMQPALQLISQFAQNNSGSLTIGMFYWATGSLSAILDNAPTYLNFLAAAMGKFGLDVNEASQVIEFALPEMAHPDSWFFLQAISVAAVFFGAMTYIGNAPNFMVKAIAESSGVDAPSFVAYFLKYSLPILLPVYFLIYAVFYSGWIL
ncbi:MAG: sodium:proton antiporter, partial [Rhodothermales bacterium]